MLFDSKFEVNSKSQKYIFLILKKQNPKLAYKPILYMFFMCSSIIF